MCESMVWALRSYGDLVLLLVESMPKPWLTARSAAVILARIRPASNLFELHMLIFRGGSRNSSEAHNEEKI
jgi:hypothetical protein